MDSRAYWIWIAHGLRPGNTKVKRILQYAGSIENFYNDGPRGWASMGLFTEREMQALKEFTPKHGEYQIEYCEKLGQKVLTPESEHYPNPLRNIQTPPCVLYVKGNLPDFDRTLSIAVVGSREPTAAGETMAERISGDLAKRGVVIVSGGALGIDAAAHRAAIKAGGVTVAFLGCGINYPYLTTNASLREEIAQHGALVSEYAPDVGVERGNFPVRNRLMAGVSSGLLVVEAKIKSGTASTVQYALEQGKSVFAVPGDASNEKTAGSNEMIKSGATPVTCAEDILREFEGETYELPFAHKEKNNRVLHPKVLKPLSEDAKNFWEILPEGICHISEIQENLSWPIGRILAAATELEMAGVLSSLSGRRYKKL